MLLLFRATLIVVLAGPAVAAPVQCPADLAVGQHVTTTPTGWQAFETESRHPWTNVQLSDGPPSQQAWLAPDSTRKDKTSFTNVFTLFASPSGNWLSCVYGDTNMILSARLPGKVTHCEIRYRTEVDPAMATAIDCR